ncbi:SRPBCC family protein [Jeotgalibacillus haloalkalitolerans]|uniref:SRPBCC family protein n=1 Tax=Jeotgalibacillus haloalkalitolerans TaxID=3104292 RepID=A0ABU5KNU0_9BACL|nr:SRPBCC family protein [Jeotgalibacillus sp. HH7-29]MDZ5712817.1 SRPBCC family protein [Jeotgalibacillus sp. HH7-29]
MITWKEETIITANIEHVWDLFKDKNIKRIMPKVLSHELVEGEETVAGAKHQQQYGEGKRVETYIVHTLAYEDYENEKFKKVNFVLGKAFDTTFSFKLVKESEQQTRLIYEGENKGANFIGRAMLKFAGNKQDHQVVLDFLKRVKSEAESA